MDTDTDLSRMMNFAIVKCDSVQYMKEQGYDGRFLNDREFLLGNVLGVSSKQ
jgi:hypothetical protein